MPPLPDLSGKELLKIVMAMGFVLLRTNGSHHRLKHPDGRVTTIPVHGKYSISKGLLKKIIREELNLSVEEFLEEMKK